MIWFCQFQKASPEDSDPENENHMESRDVRESFRRIKTLLCILRKLKCHGNCCPEKNIILEAEGLLLVNDFNPSI